MKTEPTFATKRDLFKLMNWELEDLEEQESSEDEFRSDDVAAGALLDAVRCIRNKTNDIEGDAVEYYAKQISGADPEYLHAVLTDNYRQASELAALSVRFMALTRRAIVRIYGDIDAPGTERGQQWKN